MTYSVADKLFFVVCCLLAIVFVLVPSDGWRVVIIASMYLLAIITDIISFRRPDNID